MCMDIGNAIKDIRVKSLLSQADFAKELGVSFSTVNRWENGKYEPTIKVKRRLKELCKEYKIDFDAFLSKSKGGEING